MLASSRPRNPFGIFKKSPRRNTIFGPLPSQPQSLPPMQQPSTSQPQAPVANLRAWWNNFTSQKARKDPDLRGGEPFVSRPPGLPYPLTACDPTDEEAHTVFGKPLKESLEYASVQISTANASGELYVWGSIPVVVAKWCVKPSIVPACYGPTSHSIYSGLYLKENGINLSSLSIRVEC